MEYGGAGCGAVWKTRILPAISDRRPADARGRRYSIRAVMPSGGVEPDVMPYEATTGTGVPSVTELLDGDAGVVDVGSPIGPVVDDVVVVGDVDVVEVDAAELRDLRDQEVGEALPARAAGVGGTALALKTCHSHA